MVLFSAGHDRFLLTAGIISARFAGTGGHGESGGFLVWISVLF